MTAVRQPNELSPQHALHPEVGLPIGNVPEQLYQTFDQEQTNLLTRRPSRGEVKPKEVPGHPGIEKINEHVAAANGSQRALTDNRQLELNRSLERLRQQQQVILNQFGTVTSMNVSPQDTYDQQNNESIKELRENRYRMQQRKLLNLRKEIQEYQLITSKVADNNNYAFRGISSPGSSKEFRVPTEVRETVNEESK